MIRNYTQREMLDYQKRRLGFLASPGLSGISDSTEFETALLTDIDVWYDSLLHTAPVELLPITDIALEVHPVYLAPGVVRVVIPNSVARVVSVKMNDWILPVSEFVNPNAPYAELQKYDFTRATRFDPVVVLQPGIMHIFGTESEGATPDSPGLESLRVIARPADGSYPLDPTLLATPFYPAEDKR